jgi:hypothetical protein
LGRSRDIRHSLEHLAELRRFEESLSRVAILGQMFDERHASGRKTSFPHGIRE